MPMARILVVDDTDHLRLLPADALEASGHHVCIASDGREALCQCAAQDFDLVLTDRCMPNMTRQDLIAALHRDYPALKIIGMTAGIHPQQIEQERQRLQIDAMLAKPMELHDLRRLILALTGGGYEIQPAA